MDYGALNFGSSLTTSMLNTGLALYQDKVNYARFLENREYNSPFNQMQRLEDAGINPNAGAQSVAGHAASTDSPPMSPPFSQFSAPDAASGAAAQSNIDLNKAMESYYKSQTVGLDIENAMKPFLLQENLRKAKIDNRIGEEAARFAEENNPVLQEINRESLNQVKSNINYLDKQTEALEADRQLTMQNIKNAQTLDELNEILKSKGLAEIGLIGSQKAHVEASTGLVNQQSATESERTTLVKNEAMTQYREAAIKFVEQQFAEKDLKIYSDLGCSPSQKDIYQQYAAIKATKGQKAADDFFRDMQYLVGENESSISSMRFFWSETNSNNPVQQAGSEGRRAQAAGERVKRGSKH